MIPLQGFCFQFEMYKTPQNTYYLQLFLRQPDQEHPQAESIRGCGTTGTKCTLDEFYKVYGELIPDEFEIECGVKKSNQTYEVDNETTTILHPNEPARHNAVATNENSAIFSIVACSLLFVWKSIWKILLPIFSFNLDVNSVS